MGSNTTDPDRDSSATVSSGSPSSGGPLDDLSVWKTLGALAGSWTFAQMLQPSFHVLAAVVIFIAIIVLMIAW